MNNLYLDEYVAVLEKILSTAYMNKYSLDAVSRAISYSSFFQSIEKHDAGFVPVTSEKTLIKTIFPDLNIDVDNIKSFNQCLWAAESYLRIQEETRLSFEAIFLYLPINKMYDFFPLYHEMDFSQVVDFFLSLYSKESVFSLLLKKYDYSVKYVSEKTKLSYDTLYSYKSRRRDIKNMNISDILLLANVFNVRIETLAEVRL